MKFDRNGHDYDCIGHVEVVSAKNVPVEPGMRLDLATAAIKAALMLDDNRQEIELRWAYSPVALFAKQLTEASREWAETREPPLFSLITLVADVQKKTVATSGLAAFIGHEIAFLETATVGRKEAARFATWLARSALVGIRLQPGLFIGPDGMGACELVMTKDHRENTLLTATLVDDGTILN